MLLAVLLLRAGEAVSTDVLIEQLWGERPPRTAKDALVNYVSLVRKALGPDVLLTRDPGYMLSVSPEQTDLGRFERLTVEARTTASPAERAEKFRDALALWRGPPFADLAFEPFAQLEIDRLEDLRLAARQDLIDAELEHGRHADLLAELETLIEDRPFDERLRAQLMVALYRAGRQTEALEAYQTTRRLLVDELGIEPGLPLRELEQAILSQDPALAAPKPALAVAHPSRRTVTVLFADLVESTEMAERLDPESLRSLLDRSFTAMRTAIERHGGTVEKFIGDAVMAVFGVPRLHEDDALRAVRAAIELRDVLHQLEGAPEVRIGVNTGEVFTGGRGDLLVTGATVNVAKRLEQAAPSGDVLIGAGTLRLVRNAVNAGPVKALRHGQAQPLLAFRVLDLNQGAPGLTRRFDLPLIGREQELAQLRKAYEQVLDEHRCRVVTVLGEAGIGKTRLAQELIASVGDEATVLVGRCVSYGEGATYLPLADMINELGALIAGADSTGEIALETRKRFEQLAASRPLVLVLEDIHWAEPTLLDLIEHLGQRAEGSILCLCLARPELLDTRPGWEEAALPLTALPEDQARALVDALGVELTSDLRARVVEISEGNPLFAEQLVAYAGEEGPASLESVPSSIEALLASRLDWLDPDERALLGRAAVIGREFGKQDAGALGPIEVLPRLEQAGIVHGTGDSFRFHHVLIRDVAYAGIPKIERADLHERYANWLAEHARGQVDLDEMVGYHLEQAARYKHELGAPDAVLAERGGEWLAVAGRRALWRGDHRAAVSLLERALELTRPFRLDVRLELDLAIALPHPQQGAEVAEAVVDRARVAGDQPGEATARVVATNRRMHAGDRSVKELETVAVAALPLLEQAADHFGLIHVWFAFGEVANACGHYEEWALASERATDHARLAGRRGGLYGFAAALVGGPRPADEALRTLDNHPEAAHRPTVLLNRAWLLAMLGRFEEAWTIARPASERLRDFTGGDYSGELQLAAIATLEGDHEAAVGYLRPICDLMQAQGEHLLLATPAAQLSRSLCHLGRYDEAESLAQLSRKLEDEHDVLTQTLWRQVQALVHAHRGDHPQAEPLARQAVFIINRTDLINRQGDALCDLAAVLTLADRPREAADALQQAVILYERKGDVVSTRNARVRLKQLQATR